MFTVLHAVLLAPLPYASPRDVVVLNETTRDFPSLSVTRYNYEDWRARAKSFAGLEAFRSTNMTLAGTGEPERLPAKMLSAGLLPLLGVDVANGRGFGPADDRPGAEGVALLSAGLADGRFPGGAVGKVLQLDGKPYTVVASCLSPSCSSPRTCTCLSGPGRPRCPKIAAGIRGSSPSRAWPPASPSSRRARRWT